MAWVIGIERNLLGGQCVECHPISGSTVNQQDPVSLRTGFGDTRIFSSEMAQRVLGDKLRARLGGSGKKRKKIFGVTDRLHLLTSMPETGMCILKLEPIISLLPVFCYHDPIHPSLLY